MAENLGHEELEWDDEINPGESNFVVLPEGDYDFEVIDFERARHSGSEKLPPCKKAIIHIRIEGPEGVTTIKHNLFLLKKLAGLISAFFVGIGQCKKDDEAYKMDWNAIIGARGRCHVYIDKWVNNNGKEIESNKIKKFYESPENKGFQPGRF
jgi:hypothetical protein